MALMPWWNIAQSVAEVSRAKRWGSRGSSCAAIPTRSGFPDLGCDAWLPFWDAVDDSGLAVNFHIGASETSFNMFGRAAWPSMGWTRRLALGSAALFVENSRVISNLIYSGLLDRCRKLKIVSVESGIGWIPFVLESIDYEWEETGSIHEKKLEASPPTTSEALLRLLLVREDGADPSDRRGRRRQRALRDRLPAPDLSLSDVQEHIAEVSRGWSEARKRKILQDNAAALYGIPV
jgi:predicted TIM-barrel fold metal-dependent hydrolase